tara:strand:+ start:606 stop:1010 length:405 start_codon:yes stop_codon:yes gene_type:complete
MISDWHPLVIHFPIALISSSVAFDFLYLIKKDSGLIAASWWTMFFGLISTVVAIITGIVDDSLIGHLGAVWPLWHNHGAMQILSTICFSVLFYFRTFHPSKIKEGKLPFLLIYAACVLLLFYGAHLGASLSGRI